MSEEAEEINIKLYQGDPKEKPKGKAQVKGKGKGKGKGNGKGKEALITKADDVSRQEVPDPIIKPAYNSRLPISKAKYKDLMRLCDNGTISKTFHREYRHMPNDDNVADYFSHSEEED